MSMFYLCPLTEINMRKCIKIIIVCLVTVVICFSPRAAILKSHGEVGWVAFSPDAKYFVTSCKNDRTIRIYDVATCREISVINYPDQRALYPVFSSNSKLIASGLSSDAMVWNAMNGQELCKLSGHLGDVLTIAFSPDDALIATASEDKTVKVWDLTSKKEVLSIKTNASLISSVTFSRDGTILASANRLMSDKDMIQLWDVKTGKELRSLNKKGGYVCHLQFNVDNRTLFSVASREFSLWDLTTGKERVCEYPSWLVDDGEYVDAFTFSADGRTLALGHECAIGLWDVESGKNKISFTEDGPHTLLGFTDRLLINPIRQHCPTIAAAEFKPNGDLMVLGLRREIIALWRLTSVEIEQK